MRAAAPIDGILFGFHPKFVIIGRTFSEVPVHPTTAKRMRISIPLVTSRGDVRIGVAADVFCVQRQWSVG